MAAAKLTEAEWSVMDALWERGELTGREAAELLRERCGWSRSTVLTLLGRMEGQGRRLGRERGRREGVPPAHIARGRRRG